MLKHATIFIAALLLISPVASIDAKPQARTYQSQSRTVGNPVGCTQRGCSDRARKAREATDANGGPVRRRPAGCPHAFCGCEASLYLFGQIRATSIWLQTGCGNSRAPRRPREWWRCAIIM